MTNKLRTLLALIIVASNLLFAGVAEADTPADILDSYIVSISPKADGLLVMSYKLQHYCTYSDWPSDQPYLQIGVPNSNFTILDWGPKDGLHKVVEAEKITSGGTFVQLDFDKSSLPKNADCFDLYFSIEQGKMAYPDPENGNITFKFIPAGWNFPIQVKTLTVNWIWEISDDQTLLKVVEPQPSESKDTSMIWQWTNPVMDASKMFHDSTIKLAYDKTAFNLSEDATTESDAANGGNGQLSPMCLAIIIIVIVVIVVLVLVFLVSEGYEGGGGFSSSGGGGGRSSGSGGGGWGGSSGRGSGCACASCACACACAGGGKVGCSRKGIGIACITKVIAEMSADTKDDK